MRTPKDVMPADANAERDIVGLTRGDSNINSQYIFMTYRGYICAFSWAVGP